METGLSIVVPCYNEEPALPALYKKLSEVLRQIPCSYEIILVDDGSSDRTYELIEELMEKDAGIKGISFSRNFGKESALFAGLTHASGAYVAVMDADLQDPPELLLEMYSLIQSGEYDCIAAFRKSRKGEPPIRSFFANAFYHISNRITDIQMKNGARDFRLMRKCMVDAILAMTENNRFSKGLFSWVGFRTYWLAYDHADRVAGKSKWSFFRLLRYAVEGFTNFSQAPLAVASGIGLVLTLVSFIFLFFIIIRKLLFDDPVDGWASLMCVIVFLGGCQLFSIGILGQYVGKAYLEAKNRPHYIIRQTNIENAKKIN